MALKVLMLKRKLDEKRKLLQEATEKEAELQKREAELEQSIEEAETEEEKAAVEEEVEKFETEKGENEAERTGLEKDIADLEAEIAEEERKQEAATKKRTEKVEEMDEKEKKMQERAAFNDFIRGVREKRDDYNMTQGNNGAIVPTTIAEGIITKVLNLSPIYALAHRYAVKGKLEIPYYPASDSHVIAAAYKDEMAELEASSGDFSSVELTGFELGALAKISKKLINNTDVDVTPFVEDQMAEAFAAKYECEFLNGTASKITGLLAGVTQYVTGTYKSSVTADDLITLQDKVPDALQQNACWIMHPTTRTAIRKLKDKEDRYLLNADLTAPFGYTLLGKPVYCSDNMPQLGTANNKAIVYGDMSGLAVKETEELEIQVLTEKFATQHAIGVVGWAEVDAKVENAQKLAALKCGSSDPQ